MTTSLRWIGAVAAAALLGACSLEGPLVPARQDPFVYVVLNQKNFNGETRAALLRTGSPVSAPVLTATLFRMERASDRAPFGWVSSPVVSYDFCDIGCSLYFGNYLLPDSAIGGMLGANAIVTGETYVLTVIVDGDTISGQATVPAPPQLTLQQRGAQRLVVWPRVPGVTSWAVEAPKLMYSRIQADSEVVVNGDPTIAPGPYTVVVKALDANLTAYTNAEQSVRSGINKGYGVFGAVGVSAITVTLP